MKKQENILTCIFRFYYEGFKSMDIGKTLWALILIKLFILFVVLKIFFFPRYLNRFETASDKEDYVSKELIERAINHNN